MRLAALLLIGTLCQAAQVKLPEFHRTVLSNGAVVVLMERSDVPMVTLRAVVRGGGEADPPGQAGRASLTAEMLRRGTAQWTAEEFSEQLDAIGATFSTRVDEQSTTITAEFLSKDLDAGLSLFADAILHPTFGRAKSGS